MLVQLFACDVMRDIPTRSLRRRTTSSFRSNTRRASKVLIEFMAGALRPAFPTILPPSSRSRMAPSDAHWMIPFRGRNRSGAVDVNLLWRSGRLYVMDNHRLAPWCFWQHIDESSKWKLFHIDRHYDAQWDNREFWLSHIEDQHRTDLDAFMAATFRASFCTTELFRWDTVLTAAVHADVTRFADIVLATGGAGDSPSGFETRELNPWQLIWSLEEAADPEYEDDEPSRWWVDVDLDYFTATHLDGDVLTLMSPDYIKRLGTALRHGVDRGHFAVVTVALSPEATGGWDLAAQALELLLSAWPECPILG